MGDAAHRVMGHGQGGRARGGHRPLRHDIGHYWSRTGQEGGSQEGGEGQEEEAGARWGYLRAGGGGRRGYSGVGAGAEGGEEGGVGRQYREDQNGPGGDSSQQRQAG